jgi:O-antigen/teichoic acid export membrane protein
VTGGLPRQAGTALLWQALQLVAASGVNLVTLVVLARLLSPADFGVVAMGLAAVELLVQATDPGLVPALVQRRDAGARDLDVAWTLGLLRAIALSAALFLLAPLAGAIFREPQVPDVLRVLAFRPLLQAAASMRVADLVRALEFRALAQLRIADVMATSAAAIGLGSILGVWGLVAGSLAGPAVAGVLSYRLAPYRPRLAFDRRAAAHLLGFGRWVATTALFATASTLVFQTVIARVLGAADVGLYVVAARLAYLSSEVLTEVVGAVAFPVFARLRSVEQATAVFRTLLLGSVAALWPLLALVVALAPLLPEALLGPRWAGTPAVIQVLAICAVLGLSGDVATPLYKGIGRPQLVTALEIAQSLVVVALVWPLVVRYGLLGAALAWLPAVLGSLLLNLSFLDRQLGRPFRGLLRPLALVGLVSIVDAAGALLVARALPGILGLAMGASLSLVATCLLLVRADRALDLGLVRALARTFPDVAAILGTLGRRPASPSP